MKRLLIAAAAALGLLLTGCANPVRSNVTTFHQWPAELADKSYVIEAPPAQDDTRARRPGACRRPQPRAKASANRRPRSNVS